MLTHNKNLYRLLGIRRNATTREIKKAYNYKVKNINRTNFKDNTQMREYLKQLDKAYDTLIDVNKRSDYDAMEMYYFLKDIAWPDKLLTQKDLEKLKVFWAKQHLNREVYKTLDFNKFSPEYDFSWYLPFYNDFYFKEVEKKEDTYEPAFDDLYNRRFLYIARIVAGLFFIGLAVALWKFITGIIAGFFILVGAYLTIGGFYNIFPVLNFWRDDKLFDSVKIIDKWVKIEPRGLLGKLYPAYFVAFETPYGSYYQQVPEKAFVNLSVGISADIIMARKDPHKVMISPAFLKFISRAKS